MSSSDKDSSAYLCVCLGADFSYEENVNYAMKDTAKLYDWAYENLGVQTVYSPADSLTSVDVKYVRDGKLLGAVPEKAITAFLPNDYDKNLLKVEISCPKQVEAPVAKGDVLGADKPLSVKALRGEYAKLLVRKRKAYSEYKAAREEMKELYNVKSNVEHLLNIDEREIERDREKEQR